MKLTLKIEKEYDVKTLKVCAGVRHWEDADVNDTEDTDGTLIPCKIGNVWCPLIDVETGIITNWKAGVRASIHYKVCDQFSYWLLDEEGGEICKQLNDYVPSCMCPKESGYGDYIIMDVIENGQIMNWKFRASDFETED